MALSSGIRWPLASLLAVTLSANIAAVDWDGNAGGNANTSFRPTGSAGSSGGGSSGGGGQGAPREPGGYMRNSANEGPETTTETVTEYHDDPANLYWRSGKHALEQGQYALAIDQLEKAKREASAGNQAYVDKLLARARAGLDAQQGKAIPAEPAGPTPDESKALASARAHLTKANAARALGAQQKSGKSWDSAYASFSEVLAEIDAALLDAPGDANLVRGRAEVSHEMAKSAYQQALLLEAGVPEPGVTMADGSPLRTPHPVAAMEWLKKATAAWPEQATIKDRYQWHVEHTAVGAAP